MVKKGTVLGRAAAIVLAFLLCSVSMLGNFKNLDSAQGGVSYSEVSVTDVTGQVSHDNSAMFNFQPGRDLEEEVWAIIEMSGDSLMDRYKLSNPAESYLLGDYIKEGKAEAYTNELIKRQNNLQKQLGADFDISYKFNYTALLNGFAVKTQYKNFADIQNYAGVKNIIMAEQYERPQSASDGNPVTNPVNIDKEKGTGIYDASSVKYDGTGTVVAVLDTGLDTTHPAFSIMPEELAMTKDDVMRVMPQLEATFMAEWVYDENYNEYYHGPKYMTVDDYYVNDKVPFAYDYANNKSSVIPPSIHGTHVSGIIVGQDDVITGVAPGAQLAFFKVFDNDSGNVTSVELLAALSDCVILGVDVINMSLGASCGFATSADETELDRVYDKVREAGINLVISAGNNASSATNSTYGSTPLLSNPDSGTVGSPSTYSAALSIGSISGVLTEYLMANGSIPVYLTTFANDFTRNVPFVEPLLEGKRSRTDGYVTVPGVGRAANYNAIDVEGKIAVVARGAINFDEKVRNARDNGAIGCLIYNNVSGVDNFTIGNIKDYPVALTTMEIGKQLSAVDSGTLELSKSFSAGPFISEFSAWGPLPNLELKPEIMAHGGEILSSVPGGGHEKDSGTSMASPNMAGVMTIVRQYIKENFPELDSKELAKLANRLVMSTATIASNEDGNPYSPRKQGAGLGDVYNAVNAAAYLSVEGIDTSKLSLGDDKQKKGEYELNFKVHNLGGTANSYVINPSIFTESISSDNKTLAQKAYMLSRNFSVLVNGKPVTNNRVSVNPYGEAEVTVTVTLSQEDRQYLQQFENGMYVEGFVKLEGQSGAFDLSIPWLAFYGDWTQAPIFDASIYEMGDSARDIGVRDEDKLQATMKGTRLIGTYTDYNGNTGQMQLGNYMMNRADKVQDNEADANKIAISQNPASISAIEGLSAGMLRNARRADIQVTNLFSGDTVYTGSQNDIRKTYYYGGTMYTSGMYTSLDINASTGRYRLAGNTEYNLDVSTYLDYEGEQNNLKNTFSAKFFVDNDAPMLISDRTKLRIEQNNQEKRYYLDLYVYDNHYAQSMILTTYKGISNGSIIDAKSLTQYAVPIESERNSVNYVSFELTDYWEAIKKNDEKILIEFYDYALNYSQYAITLPRVTAETLAFKNPNVARNINRNQTLDLKTELTASPAGANSWLWGLKWESSDESVALVNDGEVFGLKEGRTTITVTDPKNSKAKASVDVQVSATEYKAPALTELKMSDKKLNVWQGDEGVLTVDLLPWSLSASAADNLYWKSSNPDIVSVTMREDKRFADFKVLKGSAVPIIITVSNGEKGSISARCEIAIKQVFEMEGKTLMSYNGRGETVNGQEGVVVFPSNVVVNVINSLAFVGNPYITKVILPEELDTLGFAAFAMCENLKEIVIPDKIKEIPALCFYYCTSLSYFDFNKVRTVGASAFYQAGLESIDLRNVFFIGDAAFSNTIYLTQELDLTKVGCVDYQAFYSSAITGVTFSEKIKVEEGAFFGCFNLKSVVIPYEFVADLSFSRCESLENVVFTNYVRIDYSAFQNSKSLSSVIFRNGCREIGNAAFAGTGLVSIELPDGLQKLGSSAFGNCTELESVSFAPNCMITEIGQSVFAGCAKLDSFTVNPQNPYFMTEDGVLYDAEQYTLLMFPTTLPAAYASGSFTLPDSVRVISSGAFSGSAIRTVDIRNVEIIEDYAFYQCTGLMTVTSFTAGGQYKLKQVGVSAFEGCTSLQALPILKNSTKLEVIGDKAFSWCTYNNYSASDRAVTLAATLKTIGNYAFSNVQGLREIVLPEGLTVIGDSAFYQCKNLEKVTLPSTLKVIGSQAFNNCYALSVCGVAGTNFNNGISVFPAGLKELRPFAFGSSGIQKVVLSANVENYGYAIFNQCRQLTSMTLPEGMKMVPDGLVEYCSSLTTIRLPESVTAIDHYAFQGCRNLTSINLENIESIGWYSFGETGLTEFNAPSLKSVPTYAFLTLSADANTTLKKVVIPSATEISMYSFALCVNLEEINAPSLQTIGDGAFYYCVSLVNAQFPSARSVGFGAFAYTMLKTFTVPESLTKIAEGAFLYMPALAKIEVAPQNTKYFSDDGILYSYLKNGGYQLDCFPILLPKVSYSVLEGTERIAEAAFANNYYLYDVTLPRTLKYIGDSAFVSAFNLYVFRFNSVVAPILETNTVMYTVDGTDYAIPYSYYNFVNWVYTSWYALHSDENGNPIYTDDGGLLYLYRPLVMVYPSNGENYDFPIMDAYFYAKITGGAAVENITAAAIGAIDCLTNITLNDKELLDAAWEAYNLVPQNQKSLVSNYNLLVAADAEYNRLLSESRINNVMAMIDAVSNKAKSADVQAARDAYEALTATEKENVTNYQALIDAEADVKNTMFIVLISVIGGLALLIAGAAATYFILKKKKTAQKGKK